MPGPCLPDPGGVVETRGGDPLAVRTESHVANAFAVTSKSAELFTLRHIPEHRGVVVERTGEHGPVGAEGESLGTPMVAEHDPRFVRGDRPQHDVGVLQASEPSPVGAQGEGGVLEPVKEGAAGRIVDRDSGAIGPGHRDPLSVGA